MAATMHQAQDNFVAEIDGVAFSVHKGDVLPVAHPLVKLDGGRGQLFKPLEDPESGEGGKPAKSAPAPDPVPVAEQKAAGVAPEDTVTIAEQKAGTPPPDLDGV